MSSIGVVAAVIYFWRWLASMNLQHYEIARAIPLLLITPLALVGLKLWHRRHNEWTWIAAAIMVITVAVDPLFYWLNFNPSIDKRFFYPTSEGIDLLKKDPETWRLMGVAAALPANTASYYQLQDALGYDAMTYTRYYDFMVMIDPGFKDLVAALQIDKLASKPWNPRTRLFDEWVLGLLASKNEGFLPFLRQANYWNSVVRTIHNRRLLDLMNVKYLVSPPGWFPDATLQDLELVYDKEMRIYLNKTVLPRAIAVNRWVVANSDQEAIRLLCKQPFRGNVRELKQVVKRLLMNVDDPDLEPKLLIALEKIATEGERIADGIGRTVVKNLKLMARMGVYFEEELHRRYPDFPTRKGQWSWEDYLPPVDEGLRRLMGMYS